jgi:pimeloyl-ACP methyl ester carboxylesterase
MSRRRAALVTAGLAASAIAGGAVGKVILGRRQPDPEASEPLSLLPPEDLGPIESFDGTELAVRAAGDPRRPALVFVHGFSLDMTTWHYQWTALSERFRCVLFDLRCHGRSGAPPSGDLSVEAMGRDLGAVLEHAVRGPAIVVGHSMGAMSILSLAAARPDLLGGPVAGTAFVGAAASDLLRGAMGSVTQLLRPRLGSVAQAASRVNRLRRYVLAAPTDVAGLVTRVTQFAPDASPHLVNYVVGLAARAPSAVWTDGLANLMDVDLRHVLRRVTVPALVMVGEHDRVTPPSSAVVMAGELPDARLAVIEAAGHMAMLERHDDVSERLGAFAEEVLSDERPSRRAAGGTGGPPRGRRRRT